MYFTMNQCVSGYTHTYVCMYDTNCIALPNILMANILIDEWVARIRWKYILNIIYVLELLR